MARRQLVLLAVAALVAASCVGDDTATTPPGTADPTTTTRAPTTTATTTVVEIFPRIAWSMPARFGLDTDADGRMDVPNTAEYLRDLPPGSCADGCPAGVPAFPVLLDAGDSTSEAGPIEEYRWEVRSGPDVVAFAASAAPETEMRLPEGAYEVALTVTAGGRSAVAEEAIEVRDHLIVALGDSYASGEGNPESSSRRGREVVAIWADDGRPDGSPVQEGHRQAHRSTLAAPPQAALEIERADPQSSVSLLFLARTGAGIEAGMLAPQPGLSGAVAPADLLGQVDAAADLLGCAPGPEGPQCDRSIDALLLNIGGNDIGFNVVIGGLVIADPRLLFRTAYNLALNEVFAVPEAGLRNLARLYGELDTAIRDRLQVDAVYLIAYPSPAGAGADLCDELAADIVPGLEADDNEIAQTIERVIEPLARATAEAAAANGWRYVDGHLADFGRHPYCGTAPYPETAYPGNPFPAPVAVSSEPGVRWFRTAGESAQIQGGTGGTRFEPADLATDGTLHPNELGHQRIKQALLAVLDFD